MTNLDAIRALCTKICSGFYPDQNVLEFTLLDNGIDPSKNFIPKDVELVKAAISVVKGMTVNSHPESGISDGWDADRINKSISAICREYNIDSSDFVEESSVSDGSNQWQVMQYNGTIQYKVLSGGGLDGNGEPIISTVSWSEPIRCLYKTVKHSNTIYQQGKFTDKSYEILIESRDFQADTVKLANDRTQFLGEFEVQDIEFVNRSGRVKITV